MTRHTAINLYHRAIHIARLVTKQKTYHIRNFLSPSHPDPSQRTNLDHRGQTASKSYLFKAQLAALCSIASLPCTTAALVGVSIYPGAIYSLISSFNGKE